MEDNKASSEYTCNSLTKFATSDIKGNSTIGIAISKGGDWVRRPSRLLENSKIEDYYKFDAVLGTIFTVSLSVKWVMEFLTWGYRI